MSLILEALRKLEKEKATADRGFVVLGAASWPAAEARRWPLVAVAATVTVVAAGAWWMSTRRPADPPSTSTVAGPVTVPPTLGPRPAAVPLAPPPSMAVPRSRPEREALSMPAVETPAPASAPIATAAAAAPAPAERRVLLQAISQRDGKPIALVNDRLMREGEEFEGIRIVAIRADEVEVDVDGRRRVLKF